MQQASLFEISKVDDQGADAIERLNELLEFYAGAMIGKLRPGGDDSVDIRIQPRGGGESFAFDGLNSGRRGSWGNSRRSWNDALATTVGGHQSDSQPGAGRLGVAAERRERRRDPSAL